MNVGAELAAARERLGLSRDDVSQRTKISVERLLAIEQEDVQNLPPMVYLKGFVREYAAAVQLNPQEITDRYLSELDDPAGLVSAHANEPQAIEADPAIMDRFPEEAAPQRLDPPRVEPSRVEPPRAQPPPAVKKIILEVEDDLPPLEKEPIAAPVFAFERPNGRSFRGAHVALGVVLAVIVGFLASANTGRLWPRTTSSPPVATKTTPEAEPGDPQRAVATESEPTNAGEAVRATRETEVPPAADGPDPPARTPAVPPPADNRASTAAPVAPATRGSAQPPLGTAPGSSPADTAPRSTTSPSAVAAEPPTSTPSSPAPQANLTGEWALATRIEMSDVAAFRNMNLGFRLQLRQQGDRITGRGTKWMENGKAIPPRARTPIVVEGVRSGDRLELRFTEHGTARTTSGTFIMDVTPDGTLRGQFASSAANSSGTSMARREGSPK